MSKENTIKGNNDITKCYGWDCPLQEECKGFLVIPNEYRQSYFIEMPYNVEEDYCQYYYKHKFKKK